MAWVVTAIVGTTVATALIGRNQADKAQKRAKRAAKKSRADARKAQAFADTEGQAIGDLGVVDLSIDDELDESQRLKKQGRASSTLSI